MRVTLLLGIAAVLTLSRTRDWSPPVSQPPLKPSSFGCRISFPLTEQGDPDHKHLCLEITNFHSSSPLEIPYVLWPYENLTIEFRNGQGKTVHEFWYADLVSIIQEPKRILVRPGQTYSVTFFVSCICSAEETVTRAGEYEMYGRFEVRGQVAKSQSLQISLPGARKDPRK